LTRSYSGGLSQIITKNFIAGVNLQVITDAGYLAKPVSFNPFFSTAAPEATAWAARCIPIRTQ